jgi:outer membrane protein assembly factor BamD (BamD/ComL family)
MRRTATVLLAACVGIAAGILLASCATQKPFSTEGLSVEEVFQRAQDAADAKSWALAIQYYEAVPELFPADVAHGVWATYEIAFIYHKMGKVDDALALVNQLLDRYAKEGDALPPAPQILAQKLKDRLDAAATVAPTKEPPKQQ